MNEYIFTIPCHLIVSYMCETEQEAQHRAEELVETFNATQDRRGFDICGENHWLDIHEIHAPTVEETV